MGAGIPYIEFRNIGKHFPGVTALQNVSFGIEEGEIHALVGENGAGKSTLLNILHGIIIPSAGDLFINGIETRFTAPDQAIRSGIVKVHQEISIVPNMTVAQNIVLGSEPTKGLVLDRKRMYEITESLLSDLGVTDIEPDNEVGLLSVGQMQLLQVARALYLKAKVISFDEPTASLSAAEVKQLFRVIRNLKRDGVTSIYVSHRLEEIFAISDNVTVLRDGEYISTFDTDHLNRQDLIKSMIGRDVSMFAVRKKPSRADWNNVVLEARQLSRKDTFSDISFELHQGEILGIFGLVGAKRTDLVRTIFGADQFTKGEIIYRGGRIRNKTPYEGIQNGIGLVPENRKTEGFVDVFCNARNITLPSLDKYKRFISLENSRMIEAAISIGEEVDLRPRDPNFMTVNLSGGNQQKVVIAKWLETDCDVLIFDEPTKGVDVGAKSEIYDIMETLCERGKSIILVSSEITEVMGISDRIIVLHEGRQVSQFLRSDFSEEKIINAALG